MKAIKVVFLVFLSLLSLCVVSFQPVKAQFLGSVYINPDGSVTGTSNIQRNGNLYTLTGNISGGIQVQKSGIIIDGAGYTVKGNGTGRGIDLTNGVGQDPSRSIISNVTLKNLRIEGFDSGILTLGGGNHTFFNNYIANCNGACIDLGGSSYNNITYCTIVGTSISMNYQSNYNSVTKNNFLESGVMVWLSGYETVDRNYWSGYNGRDADGDGIGDTPHIRIVGNETLYIDYHPLMKPVNISDGEIPPIPDTMPPTISIISPQNKTYTVNNVSLTFTVSESTPWIGYSLDRQTNVTITKNETLTGISEGSHSLTIYAEDEAGNTGVSETIYFTIAKNEELPIMWVMVAITITAIGAVALIVYFRKIKKTKSIKPT